MLFRKCVYALAAGSAALVTVTGCGSDDEADNAATTSVSAAHTSADHSAHSSAAATASAAVSSALDAAREGIQNVINAALAAAPITFDAGSSDLGTLDEVTLKAVAVPLQGNDTRIEVKTWAQDSDADRAKDLAEARGSNIAAALEADGIDRGRITVRAEGNPKESDVQVDQAEIEVVGA
ncbi:OmpA family protein [Nocardia takedensis]|uniref:OmpA family protein n=1 Tax=Nocardia takedensis TaxID=259390 RepID=UPI000592F384|nr:OmpA family protein [Nocardia takedensis]